MNISFTPTLINSTELVGNIRMRHVGTQVYSVQTCRVQVNSEGINLLPDEDKDDLPSYAKDKRVNHAICEMVATYYNAVRRATATTRLDINLDPPADLDEQLLRILSASNRNNIPEPGRLSKSLIQAIKEVRDMSHWGLREAKNIVEEFRFQYPTLERIREYRERKGI